MLQEEKLKPISKSNSSNANINSSSNKHSNGFALVDHSATASAKKTIEIPSVYEIIKPAAPVLPVKNEPAEIVLPVFASKEETVSPLAIEPKITTPTLTQVVSNIQQDKLSKSGSSSATNVQDETRSLSSNEYHPAEHALSQSYPVQYKSTIAPRQTVISRRSANPSAVQLHQSSSQLIGSAPISLRPTTVTSAAMQSPAGTALK